MHSVKRMLVSFAIIGASVGPLSPAQAADNEKVRIGIHFTSGNGYYYPYHGHVHYDHQAGHYPYYSRHTHRIERHRYAPQSYSSGRYSRHHHEPNYHRHGHKDRGHCTLPSRRHDLRKDHRPRVRYFYDG